jgi:outer membrane lipoprotein carrier protein
LKTSLRAQIKPGSGQATKIKMLKTRNNSDNPFIRIICFAQAVVLLIALANLRADAQDLSQLIDGIQAKYSRMKGLAADFQQVYTGRDGRTLRESGHLLLKRPGKARWDYTSPERKLFVSDGKNVYFYVAGERQAAKSSIRASADPQIPFLFLLGRGNLRRDFSKIEMINDESPVGAGNRMLRLFPKSAPEDFKQLIVEVSPESFEVRRLVIFERNGARMDFVLTNMRENHVAADSEFQFNPPAGVIVKQQ